MGSTGMWLKVRQFLLSYLRYYNPGLDLCECLHLSLMSIIPARLPRGIVRHDDQRIKTWKEAA